MQRALYRCASTVAPASLDELRPPPGERAIALRCTMRGCTSCARFEAEERDDYERDMDVSEIVPWDCTGRAHRALATAAGVEHVPAYVIVPPHPAPIRVSGTNSR